MRSRVRAPSLRNATVTPGPGALDVYAIINPVSGRKHLRQDLRAIGRLLDAEGLRLRCCVTKGPRHATRIAADVPDEARAVIAVGGDGTVREVVEGLIGRQVPFLVLPTGTENIVARHFAMPRKPADVVRRILRGVARPLDIGAVNDRHFLIVSGVGFDADVVDRLTSIRTGHIGYPDYFWPIWRTFAGHRFPDLEVEADGRVLFRGPGLVLTGNLPRYSIGLRILDRARWNDGLLDVCVYPCASRARLVAHSLQTLLSRHLHTGNAIYAQSPTVTVRSSRRVRYQVDGDVGGVLPVTYHVITGAVRCVMAD